MAEESERSQEMSHLFALVRDVCTKEDLAGVVIVFDLCQYHTEYFLPASWNGIVRHSSRPYDWAVDLDAARDGPDRTSAKYAGTKHLFRALMDFGQKIKDHSNQMLHAMNAAKAAHHARHPKAKRYG